ncbi:MAG: hypothetical protein D3X82_08780 [Candidatus Leucobacter sulfamidivorax]|nr:hypothetical protein [Candidatus Leucobacter sulfamidivorax]
MAEPDGSSPIGALLWLTRAVPWTPLAVLSYVASITVGTLSLRGRRIHRGWHSGLFVLTCVLTAAAAAFSFPGHWVRGLLLALALVPLVLLPLVTVPVSRHPRRHLLLGLAASPCCLGALILWAVRP